MKITNIRDATSWFQVLETTDRSQTAVMVLANGGQSSEETNVHPQSDQVLLVIEGELLAEVGGMKSTMRQEDSCIVPAGLPHRFENCGSSRAVTFNVYSPPAYSPGEKD
jgi:mannose-6-phosphate isomerase-like protein (cupin superfamily)